MIEMFDFRSPDIAPDANYMSDVTQLNTRNYKRSLVILQCPQIAYNSVV